MQALSLFELNEFIRRITALNFPEPIWVRAEIAQYSIARGNHFISLVEKDESAGGVITAESEAVIWSGQFHRMAAAMNVPVKAILQEGMEVLIKVQPEFHERYGLKLIIVEIDTAYTIGKLALERQKIIEQLREKQLLDLNAEVRLAPVIQNIAILSNDTAAGYQDFMDQITRNRFGYVFQTRLFKTAMQGENTVAEALQNLKRIRRSGINFDCVIIIRGGGAKLTLKAFDNYELSEAIAKFPIPVMSGIGHERDESVLDLVAHTSLKTPTAVAEFIIQHNYSFESDLLLLGRQFGQQVRYRLGNEVLKLKNAQMEMKHLALASLKSDLQKVLQCSLILPTQVHRKLQTERKELDHASLIADLLNVEKTLTRGFSLTTNEAGTLLTSSLQLKKGDTIVTRLKDGTVNSKITKA